VADHPNVVGDQEVQWSEQHHGQNFGRRRRSLGLAAGGDKPDCSLYEVPPGCPAWPYRGHLANEEAIYVLEGLGTLRIGGKEGQVSEGDHLVLSAKAEGAHQLINSSGGGAEVKRRGST
jgi:uncharacterized cupin superfamily protein